MTEPRAVVLLSGGMDSTTTAAIALSRGFDVHALTFRYGQRHAVELEAARRVASHLGIHRHIVLDIDLRPFGGSALTGAVEVPKDTPMERMYHAGHVRMLELDEYIGLVCDFLERLPPTMVMQRLSGDAPPDYLVAPAWCADKPRLLREIHSELERRDSWQGKMFQQEATPGTGLRIGNPAPAS